MTAEVKPFETDEDVLEVVRKFESCEYAPDDFGHRLHLTVALVYLLDSPYAEALERMRRSLRRFVAHHKLSRVYHETGDRPENTTELEPWNMVWVTKAAGLLTLRLARSPETVAKLLAR